MIMDTMIIIVKGRMYHLVATTETSPRIKVQEGQGNFWRANTKLPSVWKGTKAISVSLKGHLGQCQKFEGHQGNCTRSKVKHENNMKNKYQSKKETIIFTFTRHYVIVNFILTISIDAATLINYINMFRLKGHRRQLRQRARQVLPSVKDIF